MADFRLITVPGLVAIALSACATTSPVTQQAAISAAMQACDQSWGRFARRNGFPYDDSRSQWQAQLMSDHWFVWKGDKTMPAASVEVPVDGHHLDPKKSCKIIMQD